MLFFDEIDTIASGRDPSASDGGLSARILGQFLLEMDAVEPSRGLIVIGATNRADLIDRALLRPGRFGRVIELPLPDFKAREAILAIALRGKPCGSNINLSDIALKAEKLSAAETREIAERAAMRAVSASIESSDSKPYRPIQILQEHLEAAAIDQHWAASLDRASKSSDSLFERA